MELYNDYILKDLRGKTHFWDVIFMQEAQNINADPLLQFLQNVVLDSNESLFCKMNALKEMISWTFLDKIKERKTLNFLLDDMARIDEELLECYRLKYLALFYQKEKEEIREIFTKKSCDKNEHIKAESKYQLGLIMFFESNDILNRSEFLVSILKTQQVFNEAYNLEENRIDAKLLSLICSYINSSCSFDLQKASDIHDQIKTFIFEAILFQIDNKTAPFYVSIGCNVSKIDAIIRKNSDNWIDYKIEFNKLCLDFYALSNNSYKNKDLYSALTIKLNNRFKKEVIEPVFKYNFKATLSKIEVILSENEISANTVSFLEYLKGLLISEDVKAIDSYQEGLKVNFPMLTKDDLDSFKRSLGKSHVSEAIYNLLTATAKLTPEKLLNSIVFACIKLQANSVYKNCIEDVRNDYIRDFLIAEKYQVRDQTRQGTSQKGKAAGEIDILVLENNRPYSLFEALNLTSLNTSYLDAHIEKIFKYDTLGYKYNYIVSYVSVKDFNAFWEKYLEHIKNYQYPYQLGSVKDNVNAKYCFSNLKVASITLIRNGVNTTLYHICVLIQE